jgi:putative hydrolase of the HAD superfamily
VIDHHREKCTVQAIFFDFGGVLAEEGFQKGLTAIAEQNGLEPGEFVNAGVQMVHESGYVYGRGSEADFWNMFRKATGINGDPEKLREEILSRFVVRPWMIELVKKLKERRVMLGILSDQVDWLDKLNERRPFFHLFDKVINSYHTGKTKRELEAFTDAVKIMGAPPEETLFIDDHSAHVERARSLGIHGIVYRDREQFGRELTSYCPFLNGVV